MKRRDFSRAAAGASLALPSLWSAAAVPGALAIAPGSDFQVLDNKVAVDAPPGKIEVVEFFWYSCPHCNAFEPALEDWVRKLPKDIGFRRVPVAFRDDFVPQQRLYYALEAMGLVDKMQAKVFAAIHVEHQDLAKGEGIVNWVVKQGVDRAKFLENFNSFSVATKANKATQLENAYKVEGVPALGVDGRFYTDGSMAKSMERALQVVEALVVQVRSGK